MAIVALLLVHWLLVTTASIPNMRVVTYNLRYDALPDNLTVQDSLDALPDPLIEPKYLSIHQEHPWSTRRIRIAENLLSSNIDIACEPSRYPAVCIWLTSWIGFYQGFQEALVRQVNDISELFGSGWEWVRSSSCFLGSLPKSSLRPAQVGVGRDDGVNAGEFGPVFYKR